MKTVFLMFLILIVFNCNAARIPLHVERRACDFCVPYMLEDCVCQDVEFCKSNSCEVPEKCGNNCVDNKRDKIFPKFARKLHHNKVR